MIKPTAAFGGSRSFPNMKKSYQNLVQRRLNSSLLTTRRMMRSSARQL